MVLQKCCSDKGCTVGNNLDGGIRVYIEATPTTPASLSHLHNIAWQDPGQMEN